MRLIRTSLLFFLLTLFLLSVAQAEIITKPPKVCEQQCIDGTSYRQCTFEPDLTSGVPYDPMFGPSSYYLGSRIIDCLDKQLCKNTQSPPKEDKSWGKWNVPNSNGVTIHQWDLIIKDSGPECSIPTPPSGPTDGDGQGGIEDPHITPILASAGQEYHVTTTVFNKGLATIWSTCDPGPADAGAAAAYFSQAITKMGDTTEEVNALDSFSDGALGVFTIASTKQEGGTLAATGVLVNSVSDIFTGVTDAPKNIIKQVFGVKDRKDKEKKETSTTNTELLLGETRLFAESNPPAPPRVAADGTLNIVDKQGVEVVGTCLEYGFEESNYCETQVGQGQCSACIVSEIIVGSGGANLNSKFYYENEVDGTFVKESPGGPAITCAQCIP